MQMSEEARRKMMRDALLSVFIYALPILLMFLSFYVTGQRPWRKPEPTTRQTKLTGRHAGDLK